MLIIASGRGFLVAFLSVASGVGGLLAANALGASGRSVGIGFLVLGAVAWIFGKHEPERRQACSLFFIPLRLYAAVGLAAGALFLFVPGKGDAPDAPPSPADVKLKDIEARLRNETATGSSGNAQEKAVSYQKALLGFEKLMGIDGKISVHLDLDTPDLKSAKKASLYVQSFNLRKYDDASKRALISICIKMLRADFPDAALHAAARGPILWGVRGSATGTSDPVYHLDSAAPRF